MGLKSYLNSIIGTRTEVEPKYDNFFRTTLLSISATGGNAILEEGGYRIHVFTSPGSFVVTSVPGASPGTVEYFVVAGGAGTLTTTIGGGGGAGGFRTGTNFPITEDTTYPITVGGGGSGGGVATNGSPSIFSFITSAGGGIDGVPTGAPGGSGGGGDYNGGGGGFGNLPPTSPPQGNPGGNAYTGPYYGSGGGGGASAAGNPGSTSPNPSKGGDGSPITWIPASYGTPGPAPGRYFAGGGGGSTYLNPIATGGLGGAGGGGQGGVYVSPTQPGTDGTANTGGGGGGGTSPGGPGRSGGSGIVVIRYLVS